MVRAILEGRKTQTRRPVKGIFKHRFGNGIGGFIEPKEALKDPWDGEPVRVDWLGDECEDMGPFGNAGDILWVRETCLISPPNFVDQCNATHPNGVIVQYLATDPDREAAADYGVTKATPSIHMPKWACRIRLKVKRVWVERVQDISEEDAKAEGIWTMDAVTEFCNRKCCDYTSPSVIFMELWDSIYGKRKVTDEDGNFVEWDTSLSWDENPWVWCCEFERCDNVSGD
jgi:hypothetical protein